MDRIDISSVIIRPMRINEYDTLTRVWDKAGLPYRPKGRDSRENIAREMQQKSGFILIAEFNGEMIGSVFGTSDGRKGWINRLAVLPEYQRQGIGHILVREAEKRFDDAGIEIIACLIEDWNAVSLQAFECMGYVRHDDIIYFTKRKSPDV